MNPSTALLAGVVGYLLGSISFARVIARLFAPGENVAGFQLEIPEAEETVELGGVSGTAVAKKMGEQYGCLTAILDMLKVAIPVLIFKLSHPDQAYHLISAAMGLAGHNWPVYHRFKGGRGLSAIYGGLLVIDWLGVLVTSLVANVLGLVLLKSVFVVYTGGLWLMIPWLWFRTHDPAHLAYIIAANALFLIANIPDMRAVLQARRQGAQWDFDAEMDATPMGKGVKRITRWFRGMSGKE